MPGDDAPSRLAARGRLLQRGRARRDPVAGARAQAAPGAGAVGGVALGVLGDPIRFRAQTGQDSTVKHTIISWNQGVEWGTRLPVLLQQLRPTPLLGIGTGDWRTKSEVVSPKDIAQGRGDGFLIGLNAAIAEFGALVYLRPLPEMNNYHRPFSAFEANGRARGPNPHDGGVPQGVRTDRDRRARRHAAAMSAKLRRLGLPPIANDLHRPRCGSLEPAGLRLAGHPAELGPGVLPRRRLRRRRRERPLRPELQCRVGRERAALRSTSREAVRDRRVGPLERRRSRLRGADGDLREDASAGRVRRVLQRAGGVAVGPRDEALEPHRLPQADHATRSLNARTASTVRSTSSSVWASEGNRHSNCEGGT